jgi:hypothetical protein
VAVLAWRGGGGRSQFLRWGADSVEKVCYLVAVSPVLVLGPVGGVAEGLGAAGELTHVGLLPRVGPQVGLQVLQPAVRLPATLKLGKQQVNQSIAIF